MTKVTVQFQSAEEIKEFIRIIDQYPENADLVSGHHMVDAKSLLGVLCFGTKKPLTLQIHNETCSRLLNQLNFCIQQ